MAGTQRGRPRAEPRDEQHQRIVQAARAAFAAHGYDGVTLSAIAADARVPRPVVYELVGTKEDLLGAVAEQVADELIAAVDDRFSRPGEADKPLEDLIRDDMRWFVETIAGDRTIGSMVRLAGRFALDPDDPAARARRRLEDRLTELHTDRAHTFGVERSASARLLSIVVLGMLESLTVRVAEESWSSAAVADLVAEFALGGYLRTELEGASEAFEDRL
jgi:AcrR family transcriptional regulator